MTNIKMAAARQGYQGARPKQQREEEGLDMQLSAANRRRKKRQSAGMKTIEVHRGRFGFGFTLSGQSPCVLSSVIQGSPAERVGLRSGDSLMTVNGRSVATVPHNEVVRLISASEGSCLVQILESGGSDSSSDGEEGRASRPKFSHRRPAKRESGAARDLWAANNPPGAGVRGQGLEQAGERCSDTESLRGERRKGSPAGPAPSPRVPVNRSHSADSSFLEEGGRRSLGGRGEWESTPRREGGRRVELGGGEELSLGGENIQHFLSQNLSELRASMKAHQARRQDVDIESAEAKCLVGYLGTIEMPEGPQGRAGRGEELQEIRNCVRRLRVEKKVHTLVLLCIFPSRVLLINHHGLKLAEFPAHSIRLCGVYQDDRRFFGLVTSAGTGASCSSSCHVFMVEAVAVEGEVQARAATFHFTPTPAPGGGYLEFPTDADPILGVLYALRGGEGEGQVGQAPPAPSSTSSAPSNSDSGIGGREAELPAPQGASPRQAGGDEARLLPSSPGRPGTAKLTVRAMPDPSNPASPEASFNQDRLAEMHSAESIRISMQKYLQDKHEHLKKTSQQLVDRRDSEGGARGRSSATVQELSSRLLDRLARPPGPNWDRGTNSMSEASFVRSLEDLRSQGGSRGGSRGEEGGPPSLPTTTGLPLARFLYSSDSNLSTLDPSTLPLLPRPVDLHNHPLNRWQQEQGSVLRPDNQYPEQQVTAAEVVRRRPRSQLSGVSSSYRASVHVESSEYDSLGRLSHRVSQLGPGKTQSLKRGERGSREGEAGVEEEVGGSRASLSTLGRRRERRKSDSASIIPDTTEEAVGSPAKKAIGRVGGWAADFDKLLADPAGLGTFAEFLKKEFSHENIYFWCAAERYRGVDSPTERLRLARELLAAHLGPGAADPVNVDSVARTNTQEQLAACTPDLPPATDLFIPAQKQIYNLMKFDSFSRFLKSDLYKDSLLADMAASPLPHDGSDLEPELLTAHQDLNLSSDSARNKSGESRRKSILPWNIRNRSKSKDRAGEASGPSGLLKKLTGGQSREDRARSSLNLAEVRERSRDSTGGREEQANHSAESCDKDQCTLTRFILPDRATTVVSTPQGETLRSLVSRLLEKRGLKFTSFDAFLAGQDKPLDLSEDCSNLGCSEVRVEPRVLFRLELPSKKSIGVKAKQSKLVEEVLGPILQQYGWSLEGLQVRLDSPDRREVDLKAPVTTIDNQRLVVGVEEEEGRRRRGVEEEDTLSTRSGESRPHSRSSLPGFGPRRLSTSSADSRKLSEEMMPPPRMIPGSSSRRPERRARPAPLAPLASLAPSSLLPPSAPESSLYEGLKQMTKGRLDDQRGLEINGELPDFLKTPRSRASEPVRREQGREGRVAAPRGRGGEERLSAPVGRTDSWDRDHARNYIDYIDSTFTSDGGTVPSLEAADRLFNTVNPDESLNFSESRLSLGLSRVSLGYNTSSQSYNTSGTSQPHNTSSHSHSSQHLPNTSQHSMEGMRVVQRPSIGDYEPLHLAQTGARAPPRSGRATPTARDYESLGRGGEPWRAGAPDYEHLGFRGAGGGAGGLPQPPQVAPKPRLSSVEEDLAAPPAPVYKRPPPPLPPKPVRQPPPLPPHAQHLHTNFGKGAAPGPPGPPEAPDLPVGVTRTASGLYLGMPGEKGYNVSFV